MERVGIAVYLGAMPRGAKGHVERLPSGSFRVVVYAGTDPITRREIRFKSTVRTEQQALIELGRLLKDASGPPHRCASWGGWTT